jgi:hypothetical protein
MGEYLKEKARRQHEKPAKLIEQEQSCHAKERKQ